MSKFYEMFKYIHVYWNSAMKFAKILVIFLSIFFTEVAVLSVSHAVIVGFGGCSAWLTLSCNASSGRLYVSTAPDLCPLLDFTLESENPALNRVVQQVTLTEWFVIFLFSKGMPAAWNKSFILFDNVLIPIDWTLNLILLSLPLFTKCYM